VFTGLSGYVNIRLPEAKQKQYKLLVFNEAGKKIFSIEKISETDLILDKTNFMRAGWFTFELYEDGKLKERNKFYLQRDFLIFANRFYINVISKTFFKIFFQLFFYFIQRNFFYLFLFPVK